VRVKRTARRAGGGELRKRRERGRKILGWGKKKKSAALGIVRRVGKEGEIKLREKDGVEKADFKPGKRWKKKISKTGKKSSLSGGGREGRKEG